MCAVSAPVLDDHQVHLSVLVPVHRGYGQRRRTGSEIQVRAESAIAVVDQNGDGVGVAVYRGDVRNMVAIKVSHNNLAGQSTGWVTLCVKTLAKGSE